MYGYLSFANTVKRYLTENLKQISEKEIKLRKEKEIN